MNAAKWILLVLVTGVAAGQQRCVHHREPRIKEICTKPCSAETQKEVDWFNKTMRESYPPEYWTLNGLIFKTRIDCRCYQQKLGYEACERLAARTSVHSARLQ